MKAVIGFLIISLLLISCAPVPPFGSSNELMLSAVSSNWGLLEQGSDYLQNHSYELHYDGKLVYYQVYEVSGPKNKQNAQVSEEDFNTIYKILEGKFKETTEHRNGADGTGWTMKYYDTKKNLIHSFSGYIYSSEKEKIIDILNKYIKSEENNS